MSDRWHGWIVKAACIDQPVELFYPPDGHSDYRTGKKVCAQCPVILECLEFISTRETPTNAHGLWGGLSPYERELLYRRTSVE